MLPYATAPSSSHTLAQYQCVSLCPIPVRVLSTGVSPSTATPLCPHPLAQYRYASLYHCAILPVGNGTCWRQCR
eukprot:719690-Rhodomonas_salina.1